MNLDLRVNYENVMIFLEISQKTPVNESYSI